MRYLTLAASYLDSAVTDDFSGPVAPADLGIDDDLAAAIQGWNDRYRVVIPMEARERAAADGASLIASLDAEGLVLAERIAMALADGSKVQYFSEGLLRRLH